MSSIAKTGQLNKLPASPYPLKSVSIAYAAGVDQVREAHDAAVLSVVRHMEEHYSHYRSPDGVRNGGMVAAKFDHATSRNIDPQLVS